MEKEQETLDLFEMKIEECDELIAEIAQLRYDMEDIVIAIKKKMQKTKKAC